jgi:hypothetical protein
VTSIRRAAQERPDEGRRRQMQPAPEQVADHRGRREPEQAGRIEAQLQRATTRRRRVAGQPGEERDGEDDEQKTRAVHQRDAPLVAAEPVRERDHFAEAARRRGEERAGRVHGGEAPQVEEDHAADHDDIDRQGRKRGQPAEGAFDAFGREGRAEHRPEQRDHQAPQPFGHGQRDPAEAGCGGQGERAEQPGQRQAERREDRAARSAAAERGRERRPGDPAEQPAWRRPGHRGRLARGAGPRRSNSPSILTVRRCAAI